MNIFLYENEVLKFKRSIGLDDGISFLFVGRLDDPRKNLSMLLRAFKIMCKNFGKSANWFL
jgi:glycosyltransferase involved in cell wall biosynthesis